MFQYFLLFMFSTCVLSTIFCLFVLSQTRSRLINQKYILTNLLITELLFSIVQLVIFCKQLFHLFQYTSTINYIMLYIRLVIAFVYITTMHHVALDRYLEVRLHLKYTLLVTKNRTLIVIVILWFVALLFAAILIAISSKDDDAFRGVLVFAFYFFFAADVTFLINAICVYAYLYTKFRAFNKHIKSQAKIFHHSFKSPKFLVPCLLILSYLLFDTTASFLSMTTHILHADTLIYRYIGLLLYSIGILSDCIVYILMHRSIQSVIQKKFPFLRAIVNSDKKSEQSSARVIPNITVDEPSGISDCSIKYAANNSPILSRTTSPVYNLSIRSASSVDNSPVKSASSFVIENYFVEVEATKDSIEQENESTSISEQQGITSNVVKLDILSGPPESQETSSTVQDNVGRCYEQDVQQDFAPSNEKSGQGDVAPSNKQNSRGDVAPPFDIATYNEQEDCSISDGQEIVKLSTMPQKFEELEKVTASITPNESLNDIVNVEVAV